MATDRVAGIDEAALEAALLEWFGSLGYQVEYGPIIAPGESQAERDDHREVLLVAE